MHERDVVFYLGSKILSAALNLASVAVFARLAGPASYGEYLVFYAWAYVVYGFTGHWLRFSFFASYKPETASAQISTLLIMALLLQVGVAALALAVWVLGLVSADSLIAIVALVFGLTIYDTFHEIGRTRLHAKGVASVVVLRAILVMAFGAAALDVYGNAMALAIAVAGAHLGAIFPLAADIRPFVGRFWSRQTAQNFTAYGWPLIGAVGVTALGQNIDRLVLASIAGPHVVGPYGAVSDLIKQCMVVPSEAIAGAYISVAKSAAAQGDDDKARAVLSKAFGGYAAIAAFGAAFILRFQGVTLDALLGAEFRVPTENLVPVFVAASAAMIFRSFYFGQVIFFAKSSMFELAASVTMVAVVAISAWLLVPHFLSAGAAIALLVSQIAACLFYFIASKRLYAMPVSWAVLLGMGGYAAAGYLVTETIERLNLAPWLTIPLNIAVLLAAFVLAARRYDILSPNQLFSAFFKKTRLAD